MNVSAVVAGTGQEGRNKIVRRFCRSGMDAKLVREDSNPYDSNAIAVYIKCPRLFGILGSSYKKIGYIKAQKAKSLAKLMDQGGSVIASVHSFYAPPDREHPRVTLNLEY